MMKKMKSWLSIYLLTFVLAASPGGQAMAEELSGTRMINTVRDDIVVVLFDEDEEVTTRARAATATGIANESVIYSYLRNTLGLNEAAACGVLGNMYWETARTFSPTAYNAGEGAWGLVQWEGSRVAQLKNRYPSSWKTINSQLDFLKWELSGGDFAGPGTWNYLRQVANTSDGARAAAEYFAAKFERCATSTYTVRKDLASGTFWPCYGNADNIAPSISNVKVTNVSASGYTVTCTANDNTGVTSVKFPTWRISDTSAGCPWYEGSRNGNTWSFTFTDAKFDDNYMTHIYAYDANGNYSATSAGAVYCKRSGATPSIVSGSIYEFESGLDSSKVIDIAGAAQGDSVNAFIWTRISGAKNQQFKVTYVKDGYYKLVATHSGKALDVTGASRGRGTNLQQYTDNGTDAQLFRFVSAGSGYYYIISKLGGYLDVNGGVSGDGINIQLWETNQTAAQKWKLNVKSVANYPKTLTLSRTSNAYDGKSHKPSVTVKGSDGKVISSTNYTVSYSGDCRNVGSYTVRITCKGAYSGTLARTFMIVPKATSMTSLSAKSKGFIVKIKAQNTQTDGYQVQYSLSSGFSNTTTKNIGKSTSYTVNKLSRWRRYYVRIRTYRKVAGKTYYSSWSGVKSTVTKS